MKWQSILSSIFRNRRPRTVSRRSIKLAIEEFESRLSPSVSVLSYHGDSGSTGLNPNETLLTPSNVNVATFGKLYSKSVDGQIYAQPLLMTGLTIAGNDPIAFVGTENDTVYAIDATSGAVVWQQSLLMPTGSSRTNVVAVPNGDVLNQGLIAPTIGITGTPVIDPATNTLYVVAQTREQDQFNNYHYIDQLHALDVNTGSEKFGGPTVIADTINVPQTFTFTYVSGPSVAGAGDGSINGVINFNAVRQLERDALTIANGHVYIAWSSYSDVGPSHGWILGYKLPTANPAGQTLKLDTVFITTPNGSDGTLWGGGNQIDVDAQGNLYFSTGNGEFDTTLNANGFPSLGDYGDSIVKVVPDGSTSATPNINGYGLKVVDYFTPQDQGLLNDKDLDLGSGGVMLLPDSAGSAVTPHLLIAAGKQGQIYIVNRDNMGHYSPTQDNVVQETPVGFLNGSFDTPAYYNNTIYYVGSYGSYAQTFAISGAQMNTVATSTSTDYFQYPGSTPTVSSNGSTDAVVWDLAVANGISQLRL